MKKILTTALILFSLLFGNISQATTWHPSFGTQTGSVPLSWLDDNFSILNSVYTGVAGNFNLCLLQNNIYCDDSHDDYTVIANCLSTTTGTLLFPPNKTCKIGTGLTVDIYKQALSGNNTTLDFSGVTSGAHITLISSATDANKMGTENHLNPISGFLMRGPGEGTSGVIAITTSPTLIGGKDWIYNIYSSHMSFSGYDQVFQPSSGTFWFTAEDWTAINSGSGYAINNMLYVPSSLSNAGERFDFINPHITNQTSSNCLFDLEGGALVGIFGGSIDYSKCFEKVNAPDGYIKNYGPYFENKYDTDYWFKSLSNTGHITFDTNTHLAVTGAKTSYSIMEDTSTNGGIVMADGISIIDVYSYAPIFISTGGGRLLHGRITTDVFSTALAPSQETNQLPNGEGFDTGIELASYAHFGSLVPDGSKQRRTGFNSLRLNATSGNNAGLSFIVPAKMGDAFYSEMWYQTGSLHGGTLQFEIEYMDAQGQLMQNPPAGMAYSAVFQQTSDNITSWTRVPISIYSYMNSPLVPAGTAGIKLTIQLVSSSGGTGKAWIDLPYVDTY